MLRETEPGLVAFTTYDQETRAGLFLQRVTATHQTATFL